MDKKSKKARKELIKKRVLQFSLLGLLLAVLVGTAYMAIAATRLMRRRYEAAARQSSIAAASREAESYAAERTSAESAAQESETETAETTAKATEAWSFIDLFNPDLFNDETEGNNPSDYAALAEDYAYEKRIWMGDSRFVGLSQAVSTQPNDVFISKGAMAYDWFSEEGIPQLMQELSKDPCRIVIINFGLNDCANNTAGWQEYFVEDYVNTINQLTAIYPETRFCFASVGLIDGDYNTGRGYKLAMSQVNLFVDEFNLQMYTDCLADYIDLSEYLVRDGYTTVDGVHFDRATNQKIYNYCVAKAGRYKK